MDDVGDAVIERVNDGTDLVQSSVSFRLSDHVESLTLTGFSTIDGAGNAANNAITGNSRDNVLRGEDGDDNLNGGSGNDTMYGGQGNDTYTMGQAGDVVSEEAGAGIDLVRASITHTLGEDIENLIITSSSNSIDGVGNSLANTLTGGGSNRLEGFGGNDFLDGGSGSDTMLGGAGDDTYVVAQSGDIVTEIAGEGVDTVRSSITYTLTADVENLILTASSVSGTGNSLGNAMTGTSGSNTLTGLDGNDTLDGGSGGTDVSVGGLGDDTYIVGRTSGITINESAGQGIDTVHALSTTRWAARAISNV